MKPVVETLSADDVIIIVARDPPSASILAGAAHTTRPSCGAAPKSAINRYESADLASDFATWERGAVRVVVQIALFERFELIGSQHCVVSNRKHASAGCRQRNNDGSVNAGCTQVDVSCRRGHTGQGDASASDTREWIDNERAGASCRRIIDGPVMIPSMSLMVLVLI